IVDRAGQWTGMVERPPQWERPAQRDGPERGLEADAAAEGSRDADRAARVRAEGARAKAGHHCDRGTATRTSRAAAGIVGITGNAPPGIGGGDTVGELVEIGFAKDDGAGRPKPGYGVSIPGWDPVPEDPRPSGGSQGPRLEQVLHGDRHAEERSGLAVRQSPLSPLRLPASSLVGEGDVGAQARGCLDTAGGGGRAV